jgi:hypothetical protein
MERPDDPSSTPAIWSAIEGALDQSSLRAGAAILVVSAALVNSEGAVAGLLIGLAGYIVAGVLAPPHPIITGILLGLLHAVATYTMYLLLQPEPPSEGLAQIGAQIFGMLYAWSIVVGVILTGVIGHLARWLRARAR